MVIQEEEKDKEAKPNDVVEDNGSSPQKSAREFIVSVASKIASKSLHYSDPHVWGVLTAISNNARKRTQVFKFHTFCFFFYFHSFVFSSILIYTVNQLHLCDFRSSCYESACLF